MSARQAGAELEDAQAGGAARARRLTEFERLAVAFDRAYDRHDAFIEAGCVFADALTDAFAEYLRCPRGSIAYQPEDVDVREVGLKLFVPEQAIKLREDGWFGFRVTLQFRPQRHLSFPISFRRAGEASWTVRLTGTPDQFDVSDSLDGADEAFFAWVDQAASGLEATLDCWVRGGEPNAGVEVVAPPREA